MLISQINCIDFHRLVFNGAQGVPRYVVKLLLKYVPLNVFFLFVIILTRSYRLDLFGSIIMIMKLFPIAVLLIINESSCCVELSSSLISI